MSRTYRRKSIRISKNAMTANPQRFVYGGLTEEKYNEIIQSEYLRSFSSWVKNSSNSYEQYINKCWHGWFGDSISNTASLNYLAKRWTSKAHRQTGRKQVREHLNGNVYWDNDNDGQVFSAMNRYNLERETGYCLW